jgi:hypothetical protein
MSGRKLSTSRLAAAREVRGRAGGESACASVCRSVFLAVVLQGVSSGGNIVSQSVSSGA